jgi:bifunctional N-acetylglucosamine-1-phosphate-uridyltransferase/glucosamine-1-phosphate-acetyltransferase GlmU-like protein
MAYTKENFLTRVLEIQTIVLHHRKQELFFKEIFHLYIEKQYHISKRTFDSYLGINAKKQLRELREKKQNTNQLNLF